MVESVLWLRASATRSRASAAVVDHALDDGLAKAHDVVVIDGGTGDKQTIGKVHMGLAEEFDGKGDNGGLVDHDVIEQLGHGRRNLHTRDLVDVAQRNGDARNDLGVDASGARSDDLGGARRQNFVVVKQVA